MRSVVDQFKQLTTFTFIVGAAPAFSKPLITLSLLFQSGTGEDHFPNFALISL